MITRHTLSLALAFGLVGCGQSHSSSTGDSGLAGDSSLTVDSGLTFESGIAVDSAVDSGAMVDAALVNDSAPLPIDAAPFPTACSGLGPAACLAAGCAPDFDDACCRMCEPIGPCADCVNYEYHSCQPYEAACLGGPSCGMTPIWACGPAGADCGSAHAVDIDSCDRVGCVPGYPSGTGEPELSTAICVPIRATSCTVMCRRLPPDCPTGTAPEGDGSCYTDRCIPAYVCE